MSNTQTPRTDAVETNWWSEDGLRSAFIVRAEFARELEREMEQLRKERDEARREVLLWVKERCSWVELTEEIKQRGWEYLKETYK